MLVNVWYVLLAIVILLAVIVFTKNLWRIWVIDWLTLPEPPLPKLPGSTLHMQNIRLADNEMNNLVSWLSSLGLDVKESSDICSVFIPETLEHIVTPERIQTKLKGLTGVETEYVIGGDNFIAFDDRDLNTYLQISVEGI